jgi:hypothetical protein
VPAGGVVTGEILNHHTRSIDTQARPTIFTGQTVSAETLTEVHTKLAALIGLTNEPAFS